MTGSRVRLRAGALLFAATLSACGGGGSHALPKAVATSTAAAAGKSKANFTITIPAATKSASTLLARKAPASSGRSPAFVSPSTKSVKVTTSLGSTTTNTTIGSPGCLSDYTQATISEIPVGQEPRGMVTGADGFPYFVEDAGAGLGKIGPGFTWTDFSTGVLQNSLIIGPDSYFWIGDVYTYAIGHVAPDRSSNTPFYGLPFDVGQLANASDGTVWVVPATSGGSQIYNVNGNGTYTGTQIATMYPPSYITTGADHNIYVAENSGGTLGAIAKVEKIGVTGTLDYEVTTPSGLVAIAPGSDGNIWTTDSNGLVYKLTPAGTLTQPATISSFAEALTTGPDGALWAAVYNSGTIARIDITNGTSHEFAAPYGSNALPYGITAPADGSIYFTERQANRVGRLSFPTACTGTIVAPVGTSTATMTAYDGLNGAGNPLSTQTMSITIAAGATTNLAFTLDGIVSSAALQRGPDPGCSSSGTVALSFQALDAAGNTIIGPGKYIDGTGSPLTFTFATDDLSGMTTLTNATVTTPASNPSVSWSGGSLDTQNISTTVSGGSLASPVAPLAIAATGC